MKIELTDLNEVGQLQKDAIASLEQSISDAKTAKITAYREIFTKIAEEVGGFNDFSVEVTDRGFNISVDMPDRGWRDVASVYVNQPWRDDADLEIEHSLSFYSINTLADKAEAINMCVALESLLKEQLSTLDGIYKATAKAQQDLYATKRGVRVDLDILKHKAQEDNFEILKKALTVGIDLRTLTEEGKANFRFYATASESSDFNAIILKAVKVNKRTMIIERQSQHKSYDYSTNTYGDFELTEPIEQRVKNEFFLEDLQSLILKSNKTKTNEDN